MSWSKQFTTTEPVSDSLVPDWFIEAKRAGASDAELREKTREFCKQALAYRAAQTGATSHAEPDDDWVESMVAMYEHALSAT